VKVACSCPIHLHLHLAPLVLLRASAASGYQTLVQVVSTNLLSPSTSSCFYLKTVASLIIPLMFVIDTCVETIAYCFLRDSTFCLGGYHLLEERYLELMMVLLLT
jgi:hypothetical protein